MRACALAAGYVALAGLLAFRGATAVTTCSNSGEFILHTELSTRYECLSCLSPGVHECSYISSRLSKPDTCRQFCFHTACVSTMCVGIGSFASEGSMGGFIREMLRQLVQQHG